MILQGDAIKMLKTVSDESVDCVITSPPYWGLRDYGVEGQIGLEQNPDEFIAKMVEVFREVRRVLKKNGTLWLNIGDSYSGSGKGPAGNIGKKHDERNMERKHSDIVPEGLKRKDLVGIPWRLAFALQADGWYLRQDIIWHKPNPMPESVADRCTKAHEYVFLLSKSEVYHFDNSAIKEPSQAREFRTPYGWGTGSDPRTAVGLQTPEKHRKGKTWAERKAEGKPTRHGRQGAGAAKDGNFYTEEFRNKRSVWTVATSPFKGAHFATFPEKLIEPMILAGCPVGGTVLDPFMGAGTTAVVATRLNRKWLGVELNPAYIKIATERIAKTPVPML